MPSAGSPGGTCCSEKMITDTKNSVGRSCTSRRPMRVSIAHLSPCGEDRVGEADRVRGETPRREGGGGGGETPLSIHPPLPLGERSSGRSRRGEGGNTHAG